MKTRANPTKENEPEQGDAMNERLNTHELRTCEGRYHELRRAAVRAVLPALFLVLQVVLGVAACGIELALLHKIFSLSMDPLPGEEQTWSAWLLALTGISMITAYHLHATHAPNSAAVRFIRRAVDICLRLYPVGMGLAVVSIVYLNTGAIFEPLDTGRVLFDAASSVSASRPFLERLLPFFGSIFSLAVGAFAVLNLFVAQRLIELAHANAVLVYERLAAFKHAHASILTIRQCHRRGGELTRECAALADELRSIRVTAANEIVNAIRAALLPEVQRIKKHRETVIPPPNRLIAQEPRLPVEPVAKRVAQFQAITVKQVLAAIDSNINPGESR